MGKKDDVVEINLAKLFRFYLKNWLAILAAGLVCAVLALAYTRFCVTPLYRANVTIYVNNIKSGQNVDYITGSNLSAAQQLVNTYVNIIKSDTVLNEVIKAGRLDCKPEALRRVMSAQQIEDTEMFVVSVSHPDPEIAAHVVNTIAKVAPAKISGFVEGSSTKIIDYATVPQAPYTPSYSRNIVLGGLLGCILVGIFLTLRYLFDMRIKTEDDIEQYFKAPVLGVIPSFDQDNTKRRNGYGGYGYGSQEEEDD